MCIRDRYIVFLAIFLLFLTGCGKQYRIEETEDGRTPADENLIVVGVSQLGSESVWRTANTASIKNVFTKDVYKRQLRSRPEARASWCGSPRIW